MHDTSLADQLLRGMREADANRLDVGIGASLQHAAANGTSGPHAATSATGSSPSGPEGGDGAKVASTGPAQLLESP